MKKKDYFELFEKVKEHIKKVSKNPKENNKRKFFKEAEKIENRWMEVRKQTKNIKKIIKRKTDTNKFSYSSCEKVCHKRSYGK